MARAMTPARTSASKLSSSSSWVFVSEAVVVLCVIEESGSCGEADISEEVVVADSKSVPSAACTPATCENAAVSRNTIENIPIKTFFMLSTILTNYEISTKALCINSTMSD